MPGCAGMASIRANAEDEDSEEDADFDMKSEEDDGGEPSDDSEVESGDAEMIEEQPKVSPASAHGVLPASAGEQQSCSLKLSSGSQSNKVAMKGYLHVHQSSLMVGAIVSASLRHLTLDCGRCYAATDP